MQGRRKLFCRAVADDLRAKRSEYRVAQVFLHPFSVLVVV